jgi:hypothetical protein
VISEQLNSLALRVAVGKRVLNRFVGLKFECCSLCSRCVLTVVVCVVSFRLLAVTELIFRCKTTKGVVERCVFHDAERVNVRR